MKLRKTLLIFCLAILFTTTAQNALHLTSFVSAANCTDVANSAGLVPCGKAINDPATSWNECSSCGPCSLILMMQLIIEFMVKIAAVFAVLSIVAGGFVYVAAAGRPNIITKAKSMVKYTLVGFIIVFVAWVVIDSILTTMNYIDPMGGEWHAAC